MSRVPVRVLAVHGVATDATLWRDLPNLLPDMEILAPDRPCSGDLETELDALAELAQDSVIIGQSGGATIALALVARVRVRAAVLHEPAVGSLLPGLLAPMRAAFEAGGTTAFATALYGSTWVAPRTIDDEVTARELAMFSAFEPSAPLPGQGPVLGTYGALSPVVRRDAAYALRDAFAIDVAELPDSGHDAAHQNLPALAALAQRLVAATS